MQAGWLGGGAGNISSFFLLGAVAWGITAPGELSSVTEAGKIQLKCASHVLSETQMTSASQGACEIQKASASHAAGETQTTRASQKAGETQISCASQ